MEDSMAQPAAMAVPIDLPAWKTVVSWTFALLLGLAFIVAGMWKLTDHLDAAARMTQALVPPSLSVFAAVAFGIVEVFSGVLLIVPRYRRWGAWLTGALLLAFMVYIGWHYETLLGADCSCFPWVKRAVGPAFFWSDGAMLLMAVAAGIWAAPSSGLRGALMIAASIAVLGGVSYGITEARQTGVEAPAQIQVDGKPFALNQGKVLLYFYDPECAHCDAAARRMATHTWTETKVIGVPSRMPQFGASFMESTGLKGQNSTDHDSLKPIFPFGDPPYAVLLEHGRQKAGISRFDESEPEATLRSLGFIE